MLSESRKPIGRLRTHAEPNGIRTIFHVLYVMRFVRENTFFTIFRAFAVYFLYLFHSVTDSFFFYNTKQFKLGSKLLNLLFYFLL